MMKKILSVFLLSFICYSLNAQVVNLAETKPLIQVSESTYEPTNGFYEVKTFPHEFKSKKPKNVIFMIGDGMGSSAIFAGIVANGGSLYLNNFKHLGYSKTRSTNRFITDSAAGGTALATGQKTNNSYVGVDAQGDTIYSILKVAQNNGLATGIVNVNSVLDATPAAYVAHVPDRKMWEEIASEFVDSDIDVFIGGDSEKFIKRADNRDLYKELAEKGYTVCRDLNEVRNANNSKKIAGLLPYGRIDKKERGEDQLLVSSEIAINTLKQHDQGFFLMIEGSLIDGGGHQNDATYLVEEMLDFDKTIGRVLEFAAQDGETLVIITADHETGGVTITGGDMETGKVTVRFTTKGHSAVMVPIFAYGPGAEEFTGINENTFFFNKIVDVLELDIQK